MLVALAASENAELLQQTLLMSLSPDVRSQDTIVLIQALLLNPRAHSLAWDFVLRHLPEFEKVRSGRSGRSLLAWFLTVFVAFPFCACLVATSI
jgi:hypothetical protein